jgi:hypothetical protein
LPVEGTMEIVEYVPDRTLGMVIHDGPVEMHSRMTLEPEGHNSTRIIGTVDVPSIAEPMDPGPVRQSLRRMKD